MSTMRDAPVPQKLEQPVHRDHTTGLSLAGVFLLLAGAMNAIYGIVALTNQDYFREDGLVWSTLGVWGWAGLILGIGQMIGGGALLARSAAGAMLASLMAALAILLHFLAIGAYPIWSVILIVVNGLVLWVISAGADDLG